MKKTAKVTILAVVLLLCVLMGLFANKAYAAYADMKAQLTAVEESAGYSFDYSWLDENVCIAHALGGIDGYDYTNSKEAMEKAYADGYRVFEGDMQLVDGRVVLLHDEERFAAYTGLESTEFDYEQFRSAKILGKYTPIEPSDVVRFLSEHPDAYFMTDSKYTFNPYSAYLLSALAVEAMEYDAAVLDRIIIQIYNQNMLESVMNVYPFKSVVYTLYSSKDTDEEAIAFCLESGVKAITASDERMTEEFVSKIDAAGLKALTHTVNDISEAQEFLDMGVSCIYTDFILQSQLDIN